MVNLRNLHLGGNEGEPWHLSDIQPLASLASLQLLDLAGNKITELGPLSPLTGLQALMLTSNQITELGPLSPLTGLQSLVLASNQITELGPLSQLTELQSLNLYYNQITELGPLSPLTKLQWLRVSKNKITELGPLSPLTKLQSLDLRNNQITELGPLSPLTKLQSLDLSENKITKLGPLSPLTKLQSLDLSENKITKLGPLSPLTKLQSLRVSKNKITELGPLSPLTKLQSLDLRNNQITELGPLSPLTKLQSLDLSENKITRLGPLSPLTKLQSLRVSKNKITELGPLSPLTKLQSLDLRNNQITELGPLSPLTKLQSLVLTSNQITEIPLVFLENIKLKMEFERSFISSGINLKENPIEIPPIEVLKQGRDFAIDYLRNLDKQPLNECKIIIVGRGGVGKTSLQKRLTHQPFDAKESQTHGIRKVSWQDGVKAGNGKPITVHFWDFGGQDIQQTLHQFFYSKNTLYILVLNKRHDEDPEDFLELIRTYGHNSPVLIAYNTMINLDEKGTASYDLNPELDSSLRSKYPNIREPTFGLCCGQEQDAGVEALRKYLEEYIPILDHVREPYPHTWLTIKQELLGKVQRNYIQYEEYEELCQTNRVEKQEIQKGLAEMLNSVGTITFFDRQFLGNYYILNPDWLTTGAYAIIDSGQTTQKKGKINSNDLRIIFSQNLHYTYRSNEYEFLLQLMEEFDLCHKYSRNEWLIPSSLEGNSKTDLVAYKKDEHRQYNLQYGVSLPHSVIHRFIARNIKYAHQDDYWRNGIVVKHPDSNTTLYVEADRRERQIRLFAKGERIRDGWEYFRKDLKEFSGEFEYEEQVILSSGDAVSYQYLMDAWEAGENSVFISRKTGKINVRESLGLFESPAKNLRELQSILELINEGEIGSAFDKIESLKLNHLDMGQLKKEYRGGTSKFDPDFPDRLRMIIRECIENINVKFHER